MDASVCVSALTMYLNHATFGVSLVLNLIKQKELILKHLNMWCLYMLCCICCSNYNSCFCWFLGWWGPYCLWEKSLEDYAFQQSWCGRNVTCWLPPVLIHFGGLVWLVWPPGGPGLSGVTSYPLEQLGWAGRCCPGRLNTLGDNGRDSPQRPFGCATEHRQYQWKILIPCRWKVFTERKSKP